MVEETTCILLLILALSTIRDVLRPESDCILIARPGAVIRPWSSDHTQPICPPPIRPLPFSPLLRCLGPSLIAPGLLPTGTGRA